MSVNEYTEEFMSHGLRANIWEREPQRASRYVQGLNSPIRERLELSQILWTINQGNNMALKVEKKLARLKKTIPFGFRLSDSSTNKNLGDFIPKFTSLATTETTPTQKIFVPK